MFQRLLLAIDETSAGEVGTSYAAALALEHGGVVHVVHANLFLVGGRGHTQETREEAARVVGAAVGQLRMAGIESTGETVLATCFSVGAVIADVAADRGSDVIVLGSHRHRRWTRVFGGGVREAVTRATPLPVLTSPSPLRMGRWGATSTAVRRLAHLVH